MFFGAAWVLLFSPGFIVLGGIGYVVPSIALAALLFVAAGIPFGLAMGLFGEYQRRRFLAMDLVPENETLLRQDGANHFVGLEGVGGWLYLTEKVLRFRSHEINIQRHELAIPLREITEVIPSCTAGLFPNGLLVNTYDGRSERFVVAGRRAWAVAIAEARMRAEQSHTTEPAVGPGSSGQSSAPAR